HTPPDPKLRRSRAFNAMAVAAGQTTTPLPIAVYFGEDRINPFGGVPQSGCTSTARCNIGCPKHAKNTIDITYLARAEREGAHVRPHREATRLTPPDSRGGRWRVSYRGLAGEDGGELQAPVVVLCAGTLGSTR